MRGLKDINTPDTQSWVMEGPKKRSRPNVLIYSSCHCWQLHRYIAQFRTSEFDKINLKFLVINNVEHNQCVRDSHEFRREFTQADVVFCHPMNGFRFPDMVPEALATPGQKLVRLQSPQCSSLWPISRHGGDVAVLAMLAAGRTVPQIKEAFLCGAIDFQFDERHKEQCDRMGERDIGMDIRLKPFFDAMFQDAKMFLTVNHPTFHMIAHIGDSILAECGLGRLGHQHCIEVPMNAAGFRGNHPETRHEFNHFGFRYPITMADELGGDAFYLQEIDHIAENYRPR